PEYAQKLPAPLAQAVIVRAKRQANYVRAGVATGTGHYQHDAFKVDIDTLVKLGKLSQSQGSRAHAWATTASEADVETARSHLTNEREHVEREYFGQVTPIPEFS